MGRWGFVLVAVRIDTRFEMWPGRHAFRKRYDTIHWSRIVTARQFGWTTKIIVVRCIRTIKHDSTTATDSSSCKPNALAFLLNGCTAVTVFGVGTSSFHRMSPRPIPHGVVPWCMVNDSLLPSECVLSIWSVIHRLICVICNTRSWTRLRCCRRCSRR